MKNKVESLLNHSKEIQSQIPEIKEISFDITGIKLDEFRTLESEQQRTGVLFESDHTLRFCKFFDSKTIVWFHSEPVTVVTAVNPLT